MDPIEGGLSFIPAPLKWLAVAVLTVGWGIFLVLWYICMIPIAILGAVGMLFRRLTGGNRRWDI